MDGPHDGPHEARSSESLERAIADFRIHGFVVARDLLGPAECESYGHAVDAAVARRSRGDPRRLEERTNYEQSFRQCLNLWEDNEDVRPLTFDRRIGEIAARLIGVESVRIWHDQALYKEPGGRMTAGHYDEAYWPLEGGPTVTAWIPFEGSTLASGAMGYVPGSHLDGKRRFPNIFTADGFDLERGPEVAGRAIEWVEVPPGAVAFHSGRTLHTAQANRSARTRRVHTMIYFADGCTRREFPPWHPVVDRPGIALGEKIESDLSPIAWPRTDGSIPATPRPAARPTAGWPGWRWEDAFADDAGRRA